MHGHALHVKHFDISALGTSAGVVELWLPWSNDKADGSKLCFHGGWLCPRFLKWCGRGWVYITGWALYGLTLL